MNEWRLIIDDPASGFRNMAVDEALLESAQEEGAKPTLRLYAWRPPALSLGYFQDASVVDMAACQEAGINVVRRATGGRAVLHDDEVTYAVVLPPTHPLAKTGVIQSYCGLSAGLTRGLERLNIQADLAHPERTRGSSTAAACFDTPSWYELVCNGHKLIGSAQVRRGGALLQHGSVPLHLHVHEFYRLLRFSSQAARERAAGRFTAKAAGLADIAGRTFTWEQVASALVQGMTEAMGCVMQPGDLTRQELTRTRELEPVHQSEAWVIRRIRGERV